MMPRRGAFSVLFGFLLLGSSNLLAQSYTVSGVTKPALPVEGGLATNQRVGPVLDLGASNLLLSGVTLTDTTGAELPVSRVTLSSSSVTVLRVQ